MSDTDSIVTRSEDSHVEWRQIPSVPDYEASSDGQVRRRKPGARQAEVKPLAIRAEKNGYLRCRIWRDDGGKNLWVHRAVCEAFHGKAPSPLHQAAHLNGKRDDCRSENLAWKTRRENYQDSILHGTSKRGEGNSMAKLNTEQVLLIRASHRPNLSLAKQFGVTASAISAIKRKDLWPHL